jgi:succinate dehydrogenase flavin-adding protein (antitoxin of CptAB toxin-antitoxin module)
MTENEAIKHLKLCMESRIFIPNNDVLEVAIKALEEIQAYKNGDCMNECEHYDNCANYIYSKGYNKAIDEFAELFKEKSSDILIWLMERQEAGYGTSNGELHDKWLSKIDEIAEQALAKMKGE